MIELGYVVEKSELENNISEIEKRGGALFVAEVENLVIGCVCAVLDIRLAEGVYGEIVSLVVLEKYRGYGVGKRLVLTSEKWITTRANKIRVRANAVRDSAHAFYSSLGYQETKQQKIFIKYV